MPSDVVAAAHASGGVLWLLDAELALIEPSPSPAAFTALTDEAAFEGARGSEERLRLATNAARVAVWEYDFVAQQRSEPGAGTEMCVDLPWGTAP